MIMIAALLLLVVSDAVADGPVRIATFDASLNRRNAGDWIADLRCQAAQAVKVATILRTVRADFVPLNEVDFDADCRRDKARLSSASRLCLSVS